MSILVRHLLYQLLIGVIVVTLSLMGILWLSQSLRLIEMIVSKGISIGIFLYLTLLLLPKFLVVILPIAAFVVVLFVYHRLDNDRELVVMRSMGQSHYDIASSGLILGAILTTIGLALSLWIVPYSMQGFRNLQWEIANSFGTVLLQEGVFNKLGNNLTVYVRHRDNNGEMIDVLIHDQQDPEISSTMTAERGMQIMVEDKRRIILVNGIRQQIDLRTGEFSVLKFDNYSLELNTKTVGIGKRETRVPREMSTQQLFALKATDTDLTTYHRSKAELIQRFSLPLMGMAMPLLALACLVPAPFNRRNHLRPILIAIPLAIFLQGAYLGISNLAQTNLLLLGLIPLVILVPMIMSLWYLIKPWQFRQHHRAGIIFE